MFGLLLLVRGVVPLLKTVTAFTLGHSVTLSLAALGFVSLPTGPLELAIALTVFVLALELARRELRPEAPLRRFPGRVAFAFGLLHGLGFAGARAEVGLPQADLPLALLAFNTGIELGQLAFVAVVVSARQVAAEALGRLPRWIEAVPVYALGSLSAMWCLQRAVTLWD